MTFEDADLKEFQTIYEEEFCEAISAQDASIMASRLVRLYEALTYPLPSEKARFADSIDRGRLGLEVGADHANKTLTSEKVEL